GCRQAQPVWPRRVRVRHHERLARRDRGGPAVARPPARREARALGRRLTSLTAPQERGRELMESFDYIWCGRTSVDEREDAARFEGERGAFMTDRRMPPRKETSKT